jgi:hypothetical protein
MTVGAADRHTTESPLRVRENEAASHPSEGVYSSLALLHKVLFLILLVIPVHALYNNQQDPFHDTSPPYVYSVSMLSMKFVIRMVCVPVDNALTGSQRGD